MLVEADLGHTREARKQRQAALTALAAAADTGTGQHSLPLAPGQPTSISSTRVSESNISFITRRVEALELQNRLLLAKITALNKRNTHLTEQLDHSSVDAVTNADATLRVQSRQLSP